MKKVFFASVVAALSLLLFSCSNFFSSSSPDNDSIAPNGKALVHFSVGKSGARTIMPLDFTANDVDMIYLSAEKLSPENEYVPYEFSEGLTRLSWSRDDAPGENVIARFQESTIALEYGTYNLKLELCEEVGEGSYKMIQSGEIKAQPINANTELTFIMEYKDTGDISISISWNFDGDTNRIGMIKAGLYTIASMGAAKADDYISGDAEKSLDITKDGSSATATGSFSSVNNGSYLIKLRLYDTETAENPLNTITDIIKINGYKTLYNLALDLDKLNIQYTAIFNPNGGTWEDGSTGDKATSRNMYSGFVPPEGVSKTGFELVGWYVFEDDVPSTDLKKGTPSDLLDPDEDYTLYAVWGHSVGGSFTTDNRALIIKTDAGDTIYQNSKINLSVTDSAGEPVPVTDTVKYAAKILYKGEDINDLGGKEYYTVEGGVITLNGMTTPLPEAKYQLYVTASRELSGASNSVTSSQTFNVELVDGVAAPETQVALYNYEADDMSGSYYHVYLTDSANVETAALNGTAKFSVEEYGFNGIAFDATGNFYINPSNYYTTIKSNNPKFSESGVSFPEALSDYSAYCGFAIDMIKNVAYVWGMKSPDPDSSEALHLIKCPNLISNGDTTDSIEFDAITTLPINFIVEKAAVSNNVFYAFGILDNSPSLIVFDISSGSSCKYLETFDVDNYLTDTVHLSSNASVTDVFAMEGAVYLLVSEKNDGSVGSKDIYRHGTIIKYVPPKNGKDSVKKFIPLKTTKSVSDTEYSKMCLGYQSHPMYLQEDDGAGSYTYTTPIIVNGLATKYDDTKTARSEFFPNVYALSKNWNEEEFSLSSPAKVIAVKPKKLVIADDGIAFYADDGALAFKNINRVVTINLERFVIESIQATKAGFVEVSDVYTTGIPVKGIFASGWTANIADDSHGWYESTTNMFSDVSLNALTNDVYFAAKEGSE